MQAMVFHEELARFHAHLPYIGAGVALVGPTLIQWGTEAQKTRFIPRILSGEDTWCQGYSEPNAGSDLTGLQTKANLEGDYFVVNGSKIWTSQAHRVDWMFLLCRTDPKEPGSRGLSYILVDMKTPGITTRPMVEINGEVSFNQVFFDNARVPKENIVGKLNEGWRVANTTLSYERNFGGRQLSEPGSRPGEAGPESPAKRPSGVGERRRPPEDRRVRLRGGGDQVHRLSRHHAALEGTIAGTGKLDGQTVRHRTQSPHPDVRDRTARALCAAGARR